LKPDPLIEKETRALSPDVKAAARRVGDLILGLEARKEEMRFEPTNDIDARIKALRDKKQKLLAGEIDEVPEAHKPAPAPQPLRLPVDMTKSKDPLVNPFDTIDVLPMEESELRPILKQAMEFGLHRVNDLIADYRTIAGKHQNTVVAYSQGEHVALRAALATLWVETRQLFKFAREKRKKLEDESLVNSGWFNEIFRRLQALEQRQATPFTYEGVYADDKAYVRGNFVSHTGSLFHCECPTKGNAPGTGPAFRLAVKRGKDSSK
jgi:hypothetical protein